MNDEAAPDGPEDIQFSDRMLIAYGAVGALGCRPWHSSFLSRQHCTACPTGRAVFSHIPALVVLSLKNYLSNNPDSNAAAAAAARIIVSVNE